MDLVGSKVGFLACDASEITPLFKPDFKGLNTTFKLQFVVHLCPIQGPLPIRIAQPLNYLINLRVVE